jgi:hypothetical protein
MFWLLFLSCFVFNLSKINEPLASPYEKERGNTNKIRDGIGCIHYN